MKRELHPLSELALDIAEVIFFWSFPIGALVVVGVAIAFLVGLVWLGVNAIMEHFGYTWTGKKYYKGRDRYYD